MTDAKEVAVGNRAEETYCHRTTHTFTRSIMPRYLFLGFSFGKFMSPAFSFLHRAPLRHPQLASAASIEEINEIEKFINLGNHRRSGKLGM